MVMINFVFKCPLPRLKRFNFDCKINNFGLKGSNSINHCSQEGLEVGHSKQKGVSLMDLTNGSVHLLEVFQHLLHVTGKGRCDVVGFVVEIRVGGGGGGGEVGEMALA